MSCRSAMSVPAAGGTGGLTSMGREREFVLRRIPAGLVHDTSEGEQRTSGRAERHTA
jgi:hypothetical protein